MGGGGRAIDLVILVYKNNKCLLELTTSKSAKSGNYEAFVVVLYCQLQQKINVCFSSFSKRGDKTELKKFRGGGGIEFKLIYKFKFSTLDNNKGYIKLNFLQKMNSQNTEWDHARFSSLV